MDRYPFARAGLGREHRACGRQRTTTPNVLSLFPNKGQCLLYRDLETRRRHDREYKRRLRARTGLTQPVPTRGRKAYLCLYYPQLRIENLAFRDGWFFTDNPEEQAISRTRIMAS
jgi:hypothetical protein